MVKCVILAGGRGTRISEESHLRPKPKKPQAASGFINGGFFVVSPGALDFIDGDDTAWEREPLERLTEKGQLGAWKHEGFWQPMDTLRDKEFLQGLWDENRAPWKVWAS